MNIFSNLTLMDILYAAILAFVVYFFVINIYKLVKKPKQDGEKYYTKAVSQDAEINIFSALFPIPTVTFKGIVYRKGQIIRILTFNNKVLEGKLLGANDKGMLCVITKRYAITHSINEIQNIDTLDSFSSDDSDDKKEA